MKLTKIIPICFLLIVILVMGSASASEDVDNMTSQDNEDININTDSIELQSEELENENGDEYEDTLGEYSLDIDYAEHMWTDGKYNITVKLPNDCNGKLTVKLRIQLPNREDPIFESKVTKGIGIVELQPYSQFSNSAYSQTNIIITYKDNKNSLHDFSKSFTVYFHKENPNDLENIIIYEPNLYVKSEIRPWRIETVEYAGGIGKVYIDGNLIKTINLQGLDYFELPENLSLGEHELLVKISGSKYYPDTDIIKKFSIDCIDVYPPVPPYYDNPDGHIDYGGYVVAIRTYDNVTGYVTIIINGSEYTKELIYDNNQRIYILDIPDGLYRNCEFIYSGDLNHPSFSLPFSYNKLTDPENNNTNPDSEISVKDINVTAMNTINGLVLKFEDNVDGCVKVTDGDDVYFSFVSNGEAIIPELKLKKEIKLSFAEANKARKIKNETILVEGPELIDSDLTCEVSDIIEGEVVIINITINKNSTGNIIVSTDHGNYSENIVDGKYVIEIHNLTQGPQNINIIYSGDDYFKACQINKTFNVKLNTIIIPMDINTCYRNGEYYIITLTDSDNNTLAGMNLTVYINEEKIDLPTDENGQAKFPMNQAPNNYDINIEFAGNDLYAKSNATGKLIITKGVPIIYAKKATFKAKTKTKKYKITLKDNNNNIIKKAKVTLKVKGKTYKATTNKKGKATFKITKLTKKGTYKAKIKFAKTKYYKSAIKNIKIKVKK